MGFIIIFIKRSKVQGFTSIHETFTYLFNLNMRFVRKHNEERKSSPPQLTSACLEHCFILSTTDSMRSPVQNVKKMRKSLGYLAEKTGLHHLAREAGNAPEWDTFSKVLGKLKVTI